MKKGRWKSWSSPWSFSYVFMVINMGTFG